MSRNNLIIRTKVKYPDKSIKDYDHESAITRALSLGITLESFLQSSYHDAEILGYESLLSVPPEEAIAIPDQTFRGLWSRCRSKIAENEIYMSIRKEMPKISMLGRQILRSVIG